MVSVKRLLISNIATIYEILDSGKIIFCPSEYFGATLFVADINKFAALTKDSNNTAEGVVIRAKRCMPDRKREEKN